MMHELLLNNSHDTAFENDNFDNNSCMNRIIRLSFLMSNFHVGDNF